MRIAASTIVLLAAAGVAQSAFAQWGSSSTPTTLVSGANDQVQPKCVPAPGGGFYMSWLDNRTPGYDPYVQRFSALGAPIWPAPGVKVADTSFSSNEDYGFTVDGAGNAVIIFRDDRFGGVKVSAQAISPDGNLLWGANAIQLSASTSINAPNATTGTDGAVYAGWTESSKARVMRLNADGTPAWGAAYAMTDGSSATYFLSDLQPGDNGSVIVSGVRYTTFTGAKFIHLQKLSTAGATMWPTPTVPAYTTGSIQTANFPTFLPDGAGGAIVPFYKISPLQCYVQWINSAGVVQFGADATAVTATTTGKERTNPSVARDPATNLIYVDWYEHVPNTSNYGIFAQCFNSAGARQWGADGVAVKPIETVYSYDQPRALVLDGKPVFMWVRSTAFGQSMASAWGFNTNGTAYWPAPTDLRSAPGSTARLASLNYPDNNSAVVYWEDGAIGNTEIVGQRLNKNGALGNPAGNPADLDNSGVVDGTDLGILLGSWGPCAGCPADLNGDGVVDGTDLGLLLGSWS